MMIAMSSPVWQTKASISRPSQIAFATSPWTAAIMRVDGFVWPPTEPMSALMTERVSRMSVASDQRYAAPRRLRLLRRGDGAAHSRKRTSDVPLGSTNALLEKLGLIRQPGSSITVQIMPEGTLRLYVTAIGAPRGALDASAMMLSLSF